MSKYIDCENCYHGKVCAKRHIYHDMIVSCPHHIPTADVKEVKRGMWQLDFRPVTLENGQKVSKIAYRCSECGAIEETNKYEYCHCGAKMNFGLR